MPWAPVRVLLADPAAYTPPYDHALAAALARAGAEVELITSPFRHGEVSAPEGYARSELFYRRAAPGPLRLPARLAQHVPGMLALRRGARRADVVHFQWLAVPALDVHLLPRGKPLVLTAHDVLPRAPRPGALRGQRALYGRMDAVVVHSEHGRRRLLEEVGMPGEKVHVIPHGALDALTRVEPAPLPLPEPGRPVVLFFGLLRPYKGLDVLLEAWDPAWEAELWIVGRPLGVTLPALAENVRAVTRFVSDAEAAALFRRADLAVLPYREIDQSGVLFTALAFGTPLLLSDAGGFGEVTAAEHVPAGDAAALRAALGSLLADPARRAGLGAAGARAATQEYGWDAIAARTLALYESLQ